MNRTKFELEEAQVLAKKLKEENGYLDTRVLPDGSIAILHDLLFTRSICTGANRNGWTNRYCFKDRVLAVERFYALQSEDDEPEGFIARRPELRGPDGSYVRKK